MLTIRMPEGCLHQFAPIDERKAVTAFLDHWRPDLAVLIESEIWPRMITETAKREIPLALINARLSDRSLINWNRSRFAARYLFGRLIEYRGYRFSNRCFIIRVDQFEKRLL